MSYKIEIIKYDHEEVIDTIQTSSYRKALMVEQGINRNLNHDEFFTRVVSGDTEQDND